MEHVRMFLAWYHPRRNGLWYSLKVALPSDDDDDDDDDTDGFLETIESKSPMPRQANNIHTIQQKTLN
jgi:hypothetical protein